MAETAEQTASDPVFERQKYVMCVCLLAVEGLKDNGLVGGGPEVNREKLESEVARFEAEGMQPPTSEEYTGCIHFMMSEEFSRELESNVEGGKP